MIGNRIRPNYLTTKKIENIQMLKYKPATCEVVVKDPGEYNRPLHGACSQLQYLKIYFPAVDPREESLSPLVKAVPVYFHIP